MPAYLGEVTFSIEVSQAVLFEADDDDDAQEEVVRVTEGIARSLGAEGDITVTVHKTTKLPPKLVSALDIPTYRKQKTEEGELAPRGRGRPPKA
jgi:hypothetical protein